MAHNYELANKQQLKINKMKKFKHQRIPDKSIKMDTSKFKNGIPSGIRIKKDDKWASTPKEQLELRRKVFKGFCFNEMKHDLEDCGWLLDVFDIYITERTIPHYLTRPCKDIYMAINNQKLGQLANYI